MAAFVPYNVRIVIGFSSCSFMNFINFMIFIITKDGQKNNNTCSPPRPSVDPTALIDKFGGCGVWSYNTKNKSLFCKIYCTSCPANCHCTIEQHVKSKKHQSKLKMKEEGGSVATQSTLQLMLESDCLPSVFTKDLAKMFVACNILLFKVDNSHSL